jgi:hypothetical protein
MEAKRRCTNRSIGLIEQGTDFDRSWLEFADSQRKPTLGLSRQHNPNPFLRILSTALLKQLS